MCELTALLYRYTYTFMIVSDCSVFVVCVYNPIHSNLID